jgi:hypothetical protein
LKWLNPEPDKTIDSITVTNKNVKLKSSFFLLGVTGAMKKSGGNSPRVFHLGFDGDVDAKGSSDDDIEAQGLNRIAFDAGKFIDGVKGKAYTPRKPVFYAVPSDFPLRGQGTISVWLKADEWTTPERMERNKRLGYERTMAPFTAPGWGISFEVDKDNLRNLALDVSVGGAGEKIDVTPLVKPGHWFNVTVTWQPHPQKTNATQRTIYFDGKVLSQKEQNNKADRIGEAMYVVCRPMAANRGGAAWTN